MVMLTGSFIYLRRLRSPCVFIFYFFIIITIPFYFATLSTASHPRRRSIHFIGSFISVWCEKTKSAEERCIATLAQAATIHIYKYTSSVSLAKKIVERVEPTLRRHLEVFFFSLCFSFILMHCWWHINLYILTHSVQLALARTPIRPVTQCERSDGCCPSFSSKFFFFRSWTAEWRPVLTYIYIYFVVGSNASVAPSNQREYVLLVTGTGDPEGVIRDTPMGS
eukprot:gene10512-7300_t